ncbi:MAG TPA: hypothetical protein VM290_02115 [Gaiellaceae bacterium]|jgi:hypothetical protein|nr:hypothetical protein [Gaiellaceae bacterium]
MTDEICLTLPRIRPFYRIAHLVLGGLAVRLDLTFEHLEDLQLALAGVLEGPDEDGQVTVRVAVDGDVLRTSVGPFPRERLERNLDRVGSEEISLRRLLETVVDEVAVEENGDDAWLAMTKTVTIVRGD